MNAILCLAVDAARSVNELGDDWFSEDRAGDGSLGWIYPCALRPVRDGPFFVRRATFFGASNKRPTMKSVFGQVGVGAHFLRSLS